MKSLKTLFKVAFVLLLTVSSANAQSYFTVGSATGSNGTTSAGPINIWYKSMHYQAYYTAAELTAAGLTPAASIQELGFDVQGAPNQALPNFTVAMGHTSAGNAYVATSGLTTVYNTASYSPTVGGFDMLVMSTPFIWNGTDDIVVDVCFDPVGSYNGSGVVGTYGGSARYQRSDVSSQCGVTANNTLTTKPVIQFTASTGNAPTCSTIDSLAASNVTPYAADLSWVHPGTPVDYIIEYGPAGFAPGTGTVVTPNPTASPYTLSNLSPAVAYTARVQAVCGTAVGDTSYPTAVNFTTLCAPFAAPYTQNFSGTSTPNCWSQSASVGGPWVFSGNPGYGASGLQSHSADGSGFAWLDFSSPTDQDVVLEVGPVDASNLTSVAFSFWHYSNFLNYSSSANNYLYAQALNSTGGWDTLAAIQQNSADWQFYIYDVSNYVDANGIVTVRFMGDYEGTGTAFYNDLAIDDVKIAAFPVTACAPLMAPDTTGFEDGGALNACWEQGDTSMDNLDWTINSGPTGSGGTGPSGASEGTYYAYIESSSPVATGDSAILTSPPINTANLADAPAIYFDYHMYGNDSMKLRVEYEIFGSDIWVTAWEQMGAVQTSNTDPFEEVYIPVPSAAGSLMRVRFVGVAGTNNGATPGQGFAWQSDMAIDNIRVQNVLADDVAVTDIMTPGNDCGLGVTPITVEVTNRGFNPQSNVPVFVSVNGGTAVGAAIAGPIPGNGGTATVDVLVNMTALGHYDISAHTALTGDEVAGNDMMMATAYHQPQVTGEYTQEFEGTDGNWYAEGDWEQGTPSGSVITGAGAGSDAFVTNLSGDYNNATTSYLYSPCFDLSGMTTPFLRFSVYWDIEDDWDGAWLEYSTGGANWTKLGTNNLSGQNWYTDSITNNPYGWCWNGTGANGSGGWVDAIIDLSTYGVTISQDTRFRFVMATDASATNEGLGIDNFGIFDGCLSAVLNETVVEESTPNTSDGSITLNPVGGFGGYTFVWSDGSTSNSISGLAPGTYDVTVTDQFNCATTGSYTIGTLCPTDLGLTSTVNPTIGDGTTDGSANVVATGGTAPYTYNWNDGSTTNENFNLAAGDYTVVVTDANGCTDTAAITVETVYLDATDNIEGLTGLLISPNPAKDYAQLNITFERSVDLSVRIADVTGRVLETRHAGNTTSEEMRFDVSNLAEGVYFMQIIANGQIATKRFVVIK